MNTVHIMDVASNNSISLSNDKVIKNRTTKRRSYTNSTQKLTTVDELPVDIELMYSLRLEQMLQ